ncbi:HD-GYP domain-containing protein [Clostridium manihotivorum]|uniref:HD family phosphohydrolase n=1 Tax=Clostridium manihotivorum TaxID=2320868 RepID=A0A410DPG8_9CLOT|nr:HD domain-containing phosphohydrolase [Clostridium manihotivorum]QAA30945.1 HD family phosphohydrolase [Clostridium manihotivorum]
MLFYMNEFLEAVSFALDFIEMDISGVSSNHGKRTAYISLRIGEAMGLTFEELHDIVALGILHDNGAVAKELVYELDKENNYSIKIAESTIAHCTIGERNIRIYPFITDVTNIIKYHHEKYDGTGYFNLKGDEIPIMAQIISMADQIEINFDLVNNDFLMRKKIYEFVKNNEKIIFSPELVRGFERVAMHTSFWIDVKDNFISAALKNIEPKCSKELSFKEIRTITQVLSKIIDSKSEYTQRHSKELSEKVEVMAKYYNYTEEEKFKLMIAADLHDLGKLAISNNILDNPGKLNEEEFALIKEHTYYTRVALEQISGFNDITEWASNHHEKLDGSGYPFGKKSEQLDFNSRLMGCLDIYQALTEKRPYREPLAHSEAMAILNDMCKNGLIDKNICKDIDYVFNNLDFI